MVFRSLHPDREIRDQLHQLFEEWALKADADGQLDFYGLQSLWGAEMVEGGEVFIRVRYRPGSDNIPLNFQLQTIPSEQVPDTVNESALNGYVRGGIRFDALGRRSGYFLYRDHPNSGLLNSYEIREVPAFDEQGYPNMLHMYVKRRNAIRGESWLSRTLGRLDFLEKYTTAELDRKRAAAMFLGWRMTQGGDPLGPEGEGLEDLGAQGIAQPVIEPNTILDLNPGDSMQFNTPPNDAGFEQIVKGQMKLIAAGSGCTYAQISGDTSEANFSSMRAAEMIYRRRCRQIQSAYITPIFRSIWCLFVRQAIISGRLKATDYAKNRAQYEAVRVVPPAWEWIQPEQDVKAKDAAVRAGFVTRESVVAELGEDVERVDEQNREDNRRADDYGLKYSSDGRYGIAGTAASGSTGSADGSSQAGAEQNAPARTNAA
jgi:lambda family phage portal protein